MRAAIYDRYGPADVITIVDVDEPTPGPGEVLVDVKVAALNPIDAKVRRGARPIATLPAGVGREFSGVVAALGDGVNDLAVGDAVLGTGEAVMRERYVVSRSFIMPIPEGLNPVIAACLPVAPQTSWFAVDSQNIGPDDTVLVSAAAGGVGFVAAQLAVARGARVLGTASEANDELLRSIGVTPVRYGPGLAGRLREVAPHGITVVLDHHGPETIEAALELGVPRDRINSTSGLADRYQVAAIGRVGLDVGIISALANMIMAGTLSVPVERSYAFGDIVDAFRHLEAGHVAGKIVLEMSSDGEPSP
jgi:NADPH:quinone reductase-like Zn-dependent oxidoreductase